LSRFEYEPTVPRTVPAEFNTCALNVSGVAVVVFSVEEIFNQYDNDAVQPDGIDTVCARVSVSFEPLPLNQLNHDPECDGPADVD